MSGNGGLKVVAYFRVSTDGQGRSGLGLDAQRAAVTAYAEGQDGRVIAEYTEVESGRRADRPELARAVAHARGAGARLVVAKLDRLGRNARFLLGLVESGADVAFCDLPTVPAGPAGKFELGVMAQVAELEAGLISERTRAALAALKARGRKLGAANPACRNLTDDARARGRVLAAASRKAGADGFATDLGPQVAELAAGGSSLRQIAAALNARGFETRRGKPWTASAVRRVLARVGA
jgi:DNA invertase Pin-like site-specific DNA recombinase